jgi:hypothetical protein
MNDIFVKKEHSFSTLFPICEASVSFGRAQRRTNQDRFHIFITGSHSNRTITHDK